MPGIETRAPERTFRRALLGALPLIALAYVLPVGAALSATSDWETWETGQLPLIAAAVGGPGLAGLVTLGALAAPRRDDLHESALGDHAGGPSCRRGDLVRRNVGGLGHVDGVRP